MIFAQLTPDTALPWADSPDWLVVGVWVVATALAIWILAKLLKWALWLLMVAVLVVGGAAVVVLLFN